MITQYLDAREFLTACGTRVDAELDRRIEQTGASDRLQAAMRYSVLGGGKRVRPALCLAAARAVGGGDEPALAAACAVELIHAYSLVHDDLPAMDDDELRRGRPTTHIAFDEATAILAGDALQALAFELLANDHERSPEIRIALIQELARAAGHRGMVGGQAIDLESVGKTLTLAQLETMHRHKTGALIEASVRMGALAAGANGTAALTALTDYARTLGLAFQVQDDLLDVEGDTDVIGKPQGSDAARAKPTYPALLGLAGAKEHLATLRQATLASLDSFGPEADPLRAMADFVVARSH
ncbi:farnesyl diphosphate synthase [Marinobacter lutaoensis]|jgi:geranylgeranyl diphosphate synthase type II|uniref:polyprenyl synthetase family protein n=1 Tax=Marinobacter lutaoensis TaxID=135739 RepID=UPI000C4C8CF8|nr:farnesyl diphosphate synthase [Marinobacter lutaoensis]MBI43560.1 geranyl transferase [Oceanospirillales bacterium]NVD35290.1 polyprenyl synthetase family protein [Marinobacter lutaoensis]